MTHRMDRPRTRRAASLGMALVLAVALLPAAPGRAAANGPDDEIPGVPMARQWVDSLTNPTDNLDVRRVWLEAGENIIINSFGDPGTRFFLYFWGPNATSVGDPPADSSILPSENQSLNVSASTSGWHYLAVYRSPAFPGGDYFAVTVRSLPGPPLPDTPERVAGSDRYTTAIEIAKKNFPGWTNCPDVVIASGEDRAAADPLAAAGLTWTYGAPILLVQTDAIPSSVMTALAQISAANGGVTVHVVGGAATIPNARLAEISAQVPGVTFDRITPAGDRFELAASIARRVDDERPLDYLAGASRAALIANGADSTKFFDALALSALAARSGYPILLVDQNKIPGDTAQALSDLGIEHCIVGGGPATVSDAVLASLASGANTSERWSGADRYATATQIATNAMPEIVQPHNTSVAAKLPDALTGGAYAGLRGGPILITNGQSLSSAPSAFLSTNTGQIRQAWALGGPVSLTNSTMDQIGQQLSP